MSPSEFIERWAPSGGSEQANAKPFLNELCDLLGVPRPDPARPDTAQNAYVFERRVDFAHDPDRERGRIDLYKQGCFVLEAKQGADPPVLLLFSSSSCVIATVPTVNDVGLRWSR